MDGRDLVRTKSMLEKLFSDLRVLACQICNVLHDIDSFFYNCEIKNVTSILKLVIGQVLQRYIKPVKSSNIIISNRKVEPFKTWKVLSGNVCLQKSALLI